MLQARQEFDRLVEALRRDLFAVEASEGLLRWLVDLAASCPGGFGGDATAATSSGKATG